MSSKNGLWLHCQFCWNLKLSQHAMSSLLQTAAFTHVHRPKQHTVVYAKKKWHGSTSKETNFHNTTITNASNSNNSVDGSCVMQTFLQNFFFFFFNLSCLLVQVMSDRVKKQKKKKTKTKMKKKWDVYVCIPSSEQSLCRSHKCKSGSRWHLGFVASFSPVKDTMKDQHQPMVISFPQADTHFRGS